MELREKLIFTALQDFGLSEIEGPDSNEFILKLIKKHLPHVKDDSRAAWCGIIMAYWLNKLGIEIPKKPTVARNFYNQLERYESIKDYKDLKFGDIVVFWRESLSSWKGHVGLVIATDENRILVLGGNQNNRVSIKWYSAARFIGGKRISQ